MNSTRNDPTNPLAWEIDHWQQVPAGIDHFAEHCAAIDARAKIERRRRTCRAIALMTGGALAVPSCVFFATCGFAAGLPLLGLTYAVAAVSVFSVVSIALER